MQDLRSLLQTAFGEIWEEVYALALIRIVGYVPLKRANLAWEKLYPIAEIAPSMNPKALSKVLKEVGVNRKGQNYVFKGLTSEDKHIVYDLSAIFTRSEAINFAEKGYNKEHFHKNRVLSNFILSIVRDMLRLKAVTSIRTSQCSKTLPGAKLFPAYDTTCFGRSMPSASFNTSSIVSTVTNLSSLLTSSGTSSRSLSFSSGRITLFIPALCAARTFSFMPPTGNTAPLNVISPVMAIFGSTALPIIKDVRAVKSVTPADGPSFGVAPDGT
jgi:hypothetical protein